MKTSTFWSATLTLLFSAQSAFSGERYEFYNGIRQMGMGGAVVATVNDETALLSNPAALGKLRDYFITIADPELEANATGIALAGVEAMEYFKPQKVLDELNTTSNRTKHLHLKAQLFPSVVVPNFGFGVFGKYAMDGQVDLAGTNFQLDYTNDYAAVFGFNFRLFDGILKIGANARVVNRVEFHGSITLPAPPLSINGIASEGTGVGSDVGMILTMPVAWLPTVAAVWRDVGNTSYGLKEGMFTSAITIPDHTTQSIDVGVALFPIASKNTRLSFTAELRDVLNPSTEPGFMRRIHGGAELNIGDTLFFRAGMNQEYWTAGIELAMKNYQLQIATYGEDIGDPRASPATKVEDRRYLGKFAFRF